MDHAKPISPEEPTLDELVQALNELRDQCGRLSLMLHDHLFNVSSTERQEVAEMTTSLVQHLKSKLKNAKPDLGTDF